MSRLRSTNTRVATGSSLAWGRAETIARGVLSLVDASAKGSGLIHSAIGDRRSTRARRRTKRCS